MLFFFPFFFFLKNQSALQFVPKAPKQFRESIQLTASISLGFSGIPMFRPMGKPPVVFEKKKITIQYQIEKELYLFLQQCSSSLWEFIPNESNSFKRISAEKQKESTVQRCLAQAVVQRSTAPGAKALQSKEFVHSNH